MPITVNLPDGSQAQFPDGTSQEAMKAAIQKKFPPKGNVQADAQPPAGAVPGSREYADWAAAQARAGKKLPQVSKTEPDRTGPMEQVAAGAASAANAVPIAGPSLLHGLEALRAGVQHMTPEQVDAETKATVDANPVASTVGSVAGTVLPFAVGGAIPGVAKGLGMAGNLAERVVMGGVSGGLINAADTAVRGGTGEDAKNSGITGAALGAAFPLALRGLSGLKNVAADAIRGAGAEAGNDASKLMKSNASQMFEKSKASGVQISPESYQKFAQDTARQVLDSGLDKTLHPDTYAALENMVGRAGKPMTFGDLHIVRQIAQDASRGQLARDATKAGGIVDAIDNYIKTLKPADIIANGGKINDAINGLVSGISQWAKASKTSTIEEALYRASNAASGLENGIRNEFRTLLRNPATRKVFTPDEQKLIEAVVRGSVTANLMKLAGKFGFGHGNASNMLGGTIGFGAGSLFGGPIGGILAALAGTAARRGSEMVTERGAQRVLNAVSDGASGGPKPITKAIGDTVQRINNSPVNTPLGPGAVPQLLQKKPLEITIHGGR